MINIKSLIKVLKKHGSNFFTGVPDSVLKELSNELQLENSKNHIIATNEGAAVSLGIGHHLATKKIPTIYMQNSGLSNAINPLISIAHKKVYSIPLILIIGWRGSPKKKDEPQHMLKGKITESILKLLNINYTIIRTNKDIIKFDNQIKKAKKNKSIIACLIEQGTLEKNLNLKKKKDHYNLEKKFFLKTLLENLKEKTKLISSTGFNSRELMHLRKEYMIKKGDDFYMVGGMGHTASLALGYSIYSNNQTICIDGDGSFLMHLGSIKTMGNFANKNFKYVLMNNNSHDSVGGQDTYMNNINTKNFAQSLGLKYLLIDKKENLGNKLKKFLSSSNFNFLEVRIGSSKIANLPRPKNLIAIKNKFMKND